jgi:hypothetical protein
MQPSFPFHSIRHPYSTWALSAWRIAAFLLLAAGAAPAQDSLRNSLAGDAAAEAQRQQIGSQPYTFKTGDFRLLAVPSLEMDWNDNVNISKTNAQSDVILQPLLQLTGSYPLTQHNLLSLSLGVGYRDYLEHSTNSGMILTSGSQLSFDMYIKDFWINLHDRFSMTDDSSTEPGAAGTSRYGTFMNTAGQTTTWDLEDVVLTLGYDHQNSLSTSGQFSYLNHSAELPLARAGFKFNPQLTAGVEGSASFTTYDQAVLNDNQSYSAGLYANWKPGAYLQVQPRAGYATYQFQHTSQSAQIFNVTPSGNLIVTPAGETIQTSDLNTWYADLTVSHQISQAASYALGAGHEVRPGIQADATEDWYFRPNITWTIIKDVSLNTSLSYEHGNQGAGNVSGNLTETYDWWGGGLTLGYQLMKKLQVGLNYRFTIRSSNTPDRDYAQNIVGITLTYRPQ